MPPVSAFVRRDGAALTLEGQPFPIAGANNYYLGYLSDDVVLAVLDLAAALRMNVLRIWGFSDTAARPPAGSVSFHYRDESYNWPVANNGPDGLDRFDRAVALAAQRGIRLIVPLVNYWPDFGGMGMYAQWFGLAGRDDFYRDGRCRAAYWQWAEHMITRTNPYTGRAYRDEPAVLAWELANEPECPRADGVDDMLSWIWEMSSLIKGKDPNHLVRWATRAIFDGRAPARILCSTAATVSAARSSWASGASTSGPSICTRTWPAARTWPPSGTCGSASTWTPGGAPRNRCCSKNSVPSLDRPDVVTAARRAQLYERWLKTARESGAMGALVWMIGLPVGPNQPFGWEPIRRGERPGIGRSSGITRRRWDCKQRYSSDRGGQTSSVSPTDCLGAGATSRRGHSGLSPRTEYLRQLLDPHDDAAGRGDAVDGDAHRLRAGGDAVRYTQVHLIQPLDVSRCGAGKVDVSRHVPNGGGHTSNPLQGTGPAGCAGGPGGIGLGRVRSSRQRPRNLWRPEQRCR